MKDSNSFMAALTEESWVETLVPLVKLLQERFRESQLRLVGNNSGGRTNGCYIFTTQYGMVTLLLFFFLRKYLQDPAFG